MDIDRNSHLPLYIQVKQLLSEKIRVGEWKPGEKIPSEEEIQQNFNVSRTTVRQAMREIELEGKITTARPDAVPLSPSPNLWKARMPLNWKCPSSQNRVCRCPGR